MLVLLGPHPILRVSRIRVKYVFCLWIVCLPVTFNLGCYSDSLNNLTYERIHKSIGIIRTNCCTQEINKTVLSQQILEFLHNCAVLSIVAKQVSATLTDYFCTQISCDQRHRSFGGHGSEHT